MKPRSSLSVKLSLTILSIVLFIFVVIVFLNFRISQGLLLKEAENNAKNISRLTVSQIEDALNSVETASNLVAGYISQNNINNPDIEKTLKLLVANQKQIVSSFLMLDTGENSQSAASYYCFFGKDENGIVKNLSLKSNPSANLWLKRIIEKNEPFWSEPYLDSKGGEMAVAFVVPAYFSNQNMTLVKGLVGIEFRLKWLQELIASKKIYKSDYIFILSREGRPVLTPNNRYSYDTDIITVAKELNNPAIIELGEK